MTHTVHMSIPIRPGTARRLGLRPPRPRGLIQIDIELPRAELDAFAERFRRAVVTGVTRPVLLTLDNRKPVPRRRWWQRRRR